MATLIAESIKTYAEYIDVVYVKIADALSRYREKAATKIAKKVFGITEHVSAYQVVNGFLDELIEAAERYLVIENPNLAAETPDNAIFEWFDDGSCGGYYDLRLPR